jgi:hypothetical protein
MKNEIFLELQNPINFRKIQPFEDTLNDKGESKRDTSIKIAEEMVNGKVRG